jgi:shikimate kinase
MTATAPRHLAVLGLMASGKTSVARELARRMGRPLLDSDAAIEAAAGVDVRTLAEREGVAAMHQREVDHVLAALATATPAVITPAAYVIEREECRAALRVGATCVWLDVDPALLARRFTAGPHRPDFGRPVHELLTEQRQSRGPWFQELAALVVAVAEDDDASPVELADRILRELPVAQP